MNTIQIVMELNVLQWNEVEGIERDLILAAQEACTLSYSPYSLFRVGCAILLDNGTIVKGANQENAAYPICHCAEGVTLSAVVSQHSGHKIEQVAIYVPLSSPASPCGLCRQSFKEYESRMNLKFQYFLASNESIYSFNGIDTILPLAFGPDDLK